MILNLPLNDLSKFSSLISNLFKTNNTIIKISLFYCRLQITAGFAEQLLSNNSIKEVDISENIIENPEVVIPLLVNSNFFKIYFFIKSGFEKFLEKIILDDPKQKIIYDFRVKFKKL